MKFVEKMLGLLAALALVVFGTGYFREYRYDLGRWIAGGLAFFGAMLVLGYLVEWYEERSVRYAINHLATQQNRRLPAR